MSTAATREQAASSLRTRPVLVSGDQAEADRLAADHPRALIVVTGVPHAPRGLQK
jgi:hypothetical protein